MKTLKILLTALVIFYSQLVFSAPAPPPSAGATGGPGCWPPPCIPIDNGIIFLMVAGALFVAKKLYDFRKKAEVIS